MQALLSLAVLGAMLWLAGQVKQGFIPRVDSGMIFANIQYPEGIPFKELSKRQEQIAAIVQKHPAVEGGACRSGADSLARPALPDYISHASAA